MEKRGARASLPVLSGILPDSAFDALSKSQWMELRLRDTRRQDADEHRLEAGAPLSICFARALPGSKQTVVAPCQVAFSRQSC
jgi:hypothetical protein